MYDFDDPAIRNMVLDQHKPKDLWVDDATYGRRHSGVVCVLDGQAWPCRPVQDLRAYDKKTVDEFVKSMKESEERIAQQFRWPSFFPLPYYGTFPDYYHTFTYTYEPKKD